MLTEICREFKLDLNPEKFLTGSDLYRKYLENVDILICVDATVCGKCGGDIESADPTDPRVEGKAVPKDKPLYVCVKCSQPYWWNENQNSRSSRALSLADRLFTVIQDGLGLPVVGKVIRDISGNVEDGCFSLHSEIIEQEESLLLPSPACADEGPINCVSAYESLYRKEPAYTNWSENFRGTLDYVFVTPDWIVSSVHVLPLQRQQMHESSEVFGSLCSPSDDHSGSPLMSVIGTPLPNEVFPSDHLLIRATLHLPS